MAELTLGTMMIFNPLLLLLLTLVIQAHTARAQMTTPAQLQKAYETAAGSPAQIERGQAFFTSKHGADWSCASCHGQRPTQVGKHAVTGKSIDPLAPAFNPKALTDEHRAEKWFRRNCKDVAQRECTPGEKADVLAWLQSLR